MAICERCGKEHDGSFGSGRFCSRSCANARVFSDEANKKKSDALRGRKAYSSENGTIFIRPEDGIPEGFIEGNFSISKNYNSLDDFSKRNIINEDNLKKKDVSEEEIDVIKRYKDYITSHNNNIIDEYEALLRDKSSGKEFKVENQIIYSKYWSIRLSDHPRSVGGRTFVHILLAECLLDRFLKKEEVVHHKNSNKLDNRFDNIYIFDNKGSHARFHYANNYWLKLKGDVLSCERVDIEKLKQVEL